MAIKFYSHHPDINEELVIGGKDSSFSAMEVGGYGPFPSYSISREDIFADDGSYLNSKYTINITGYATMKPSDATDILVKGGRQSKIIGEQVIKLQSNRSKWPMSGLGTLDIELYDGTDNVLQFHDARLTNIEIPEATEESSGLHYTEYSFTFEAYNFNDHALPTDSLSSVGESWTFDLNEGQFSYEYDDISNQACKTYTISRTLSATGIKKYVNGILSKDSWRSASNWIEKRILNIIETDTKIDEHINSITIENDDIKFQPIKMNSEGSSEKIVPDLNNQQRYRTFNHSRNSNTDIPNGSCTVTDTWILALDSSTCLQSFQSSVDFNQNSNAPTIEVSGEITGLNTYNITEKKNNAYLNAKNIINKNMSKAFNLAQSAYDNSGISGNLIPSAYEVKNNKQQTSVSHNRNNGTITWSVTYIADKFLCDPDYVQSENITETYDNPYGEAKPVAIIPIIGRPNGPVIQTFTTGKEMKKNVTIDIILKPNKRTLANGRLAVKGFLSGVGLISTNSESFNPITGAYSINIEWTS
jgi:hypothetical protein